MKVDPDAALAESTYSVEDERRSQLASDVMWMSLMAPFAGISFAQQQFGIFHYYADSGRQTCFSPQTAAFSVRIFFLYPFPASFLERKICWKSSRSL